MSSCRFVATNRLYPRTKAEHGSRFTFDQSPIFETVTNYTVVYGTGKENEQPEC